MTKQDVQIHVCSVEDSSPETIMLPGQVGSDDQAHLSPSTRKRSWEDFATTADEAGATDKLGESPVRRTHSDPNICEGRGGSLMLQIKPITMRYGSKRNAAAHAAASHPRVHRITRRQAMMAIIKYGTLSVVFMILLSLPKIVGQGFEDTHLETLGAGTSAVLPLSDEEKGLLNVHLTIASCRFPNASSAFNAKVMARVMEDGKQLGESFEKYLETEIYHEVSVAAPPAAHRRLLSRRLGVGRRLNSGGGTSHFKFFSMEFDITNHSPDHQAKLVVDTDCPTVLAAKIEHATLGPISHAQVYLALFLLIIVLALILVEVIHRTLAPFLGATAVLFCLAMEHRLPPVATLVTWMDIGTLALLFGMMVVVALLSRTGIFEWCAVRIFQASGASMWKLYCLMMLFDCLMSAFLDNVTTMLLLGPVVMSLCKSIGQDAKPMLISLALFGTVGGTATMIGDPPNIILGNAFAEDISFVDFIAVLGPGVLLCIPPTLLFGRFYYGKEYFSKEFPVSVETLKAQYPIREPMLLIQAGSVLVACILAFFAHPITHMDPAYVACIGATVVLVTASHHDFEYAIKHVEWDSLLFFASLFVFTEGLAEMGLLHEIAEVISSIIKSIPVDSRQMAANIILHCFSAFASALVDNIPFTTTMIPVLRTLALNVEGLTIEPLIWSLAFGACLGGMGTLIGASANVVMAGIAEEEGIHVSFMDFLKIGFPMMIIAVGVSVVYMIVLQAAGTWDH